MNKAELAKRYLLFIISEGVKFSVSMGKILL